MTQTSEASHAEAEAGRPRYTHRQILKILAGLMMAMLTSMMSTSVVATALPTIVGDLGGQDKLAWVASATLLTMTASTPLWGKLSDIAGRKLMFQTALLVFVAASVAAGLSQNIGQLIAARAVQGIGVGGLSALSQVILGDVVEPRQRGRYAGYMGAVFGVSTVAGPLLGGFLVHAPWLGWRWCFYVSVPLAVVAFLVIQRVLKLPRTRRDTRVDVFGAFTITGGATTLMLLLSMGGTEFAWNSAWTYVLLGLTGLLLALAVVAERTARDPILPPRLFRNRMFVLTSFVSVCSSMAMFGVMIYMPQYLQIAKEMSPAASGLMTLPLVVGMLVTSTGSGQIVTRTGRYKIFPVVGMLCVAGGMFLLSRLHTGSSNLLIGVDLAVLGVGMGLTMQILILAAQNAAGPADLAATTSGVSFFRNLGGAMGVAAFGAILTNRVAAEITGGLRAAGLPAGGAVGDLGSPEEIGKLPEPVKGIIQDAFTSAQETVFLVGIPIGLIGFLAVLAVKELPLRGSAGRGTTPADAPEQDAPEQEGAGRAPAPAPRMGAVAAVGRARVDGDPRLATVAAAPGASGVSGNGAAPAADPAVRARLRAERTAQDTVPTEQPTGQGPAERRPGEQGGVPVRGVVRTGHGTPVPSAALTLIGVDGHQLARATTGADGRYALPTPGPGEYVLIAATGGHEPQAATLVVGDRPVEFDLLLAGSGGLAGTVRGGDGAPIPNAMVVITDAHGDVIGTGRTDGTGNYAFTDLASGGYTLAVSAAAHRPVAMPVEIAGTGQARQDVEMPPGARIRGTVRTAAGEPAGDAQVTLLDAAGDAVAMMITGPDGEYFFTDLPGGRYTVIAAGDPPVVSELMLSGSGPDDHDLTLGHPGE